MHIADNINSYRIDPESYNCINISVDGSPVSDLSFPDLENKIQEVLDLDQNVCLELFLDLHAHDFTFTNPLAFAIRKRSLEALLQRICFIPENKIERIILYRGSFDFSNEIAHNATLSEEYKKWKSELLENTIDEEHLLHVFSSQLLSNFFHSLATILPDHIKGTLLFTLPPHLSVAKTAELISEETFAHLEVGVKNAPFYIEGIAWGQGNGSHTLSYKPMTTLKEEDVKVAVILPFFGKCDYDRFEKICCYLTENGIAYKVIEENLLNEKWFDIDKIIFDYDASSFDGKRMVDGFVAAGGMAYVFDENVSFDRENVAYEYGYLGFDAFYKEKVLIKNS